ncbi:MAG: MBL fold metallo-hydrolase [Gemmatimonadota bacterium]|nr:MAG: MBL fold metallo-hydrolase [Gemmatimonadota bacterium]
MFSLFSALLLLHSLVWAVPEVSGTAGTADPGIHVWYLGSNGWAVNIGEKLLVFDYQEGSDPNPPAAGEGRNLQRGYIDPAELDSFDTYVFVTHAHQDHFEPVILDWQEQVDRINYFFGWEAGDDPEHHYMIGPRAQAQVGDVEVYTINSYHTGIPEVAFLVRVEGYTIYHNGDYKAEYQEDYAYLQTVADDIDIAFVIGITYEGHQYFQQTLCLAEMFHPTYVFPMNREGDEYKSLQFAQLLTSHVSGVNVLCPEQRGDDYLIEGGRGDVNLDGVINILDVIQAVNILLEIGNPPMECENRAADCNGDENVDILDILGMINVILGIGECQPRLPRIM